MKSGQGERNHRDAQNNVKKKLKKRIIIYIKKVRVIFQLTGFLKSNIKLGSVFLESTFLSQDLGHTHIFFLSFYYPKFVWFHLL